MPIKINELVFHIDIQNPEQQRGNLVTNMLDVDYIERYTKIIQNDIFEMIEDKKNR